MEQNNQLLQGCEEEGGVPVNVLHTFFTNSNSYFRLLIVLIFFPLNFTVFFFFFFFFFGGGGGGEFHFVSTAFPFYFDCFH